MIEGLSGLQISFVPPVGTGQFGWVPAPEDFKAFAYARAIFGARSIGDAFRPEVEPGLLLRYPSWPEPVDWKPVFPVDSQLVDALDPNSPLCRHTCSANLPSGIELVSAFLPG